MLVEMRFSRDMDELHTAEGIRFMSHPNFRCFTVIAYCWLWTPCIRTHIFGKSHIGIYINNIITVNIQKQEIVKPYEWRRIYSKPQPIQRNKTYYNAKYLGNGHPRKVKYTTC